MKSKLDFYIAFYEQLALKRFQAVADHSNEHIALICFNGKNIAYFTKADRVEVNPYAEISYSIIEQIREILAETALNFINSFDYRQIFTEGELAAIHNNLIRVLIMPNNDLDVEAVQELDEIITKIQYLVPDFGASEISSELENESDICEGVEP